MHKIVFQLFSLFLLSFFFYPPSVSPNNPFEFLRPGPFIPKSTLTQLKIHFVWPKSEGVCAMGLLHSALKLVLWRRMGYYYLPATHPAIKTSGATSPQRSAAALPPFLSLSRSSYMSHTQQWAWLLTPHQPLCYTDRPKNHTLLSSVALLLLLSIGYSSLGVSFFFHFCEWASVAGVGSLWMDWLPGWLTDWQTGKERRSCVSIKKGQCWEVKRGATEPLRSLEIQRHVRRIVKLKVR